MRRRRFGGNGNAVLVLVIGVGMFFLLLYLLSMLFIGSERKARNVVEDFYEYESNGNYGKSWELLHPELQGRFDRGAYVQDRAHVFNGHFGADTFSYVVSGRKKLKNWKMVKNGEALESVYQFEVEQVYHGKYGHFVFLQYVYVGKEDGAWRILWDFKK